MPPSAQAALPKTPAQTPEEVTALLQSFLAENPAASLLEDGRILFDLRSTQHAVSADHGRCSLQLWNDERNLVRYILSANPKPGGALRLSAQRLGQPRPQTLDLVTSRQPRQPATRDAARSRYLRILERVLHRHFPDDTLEALRSAMDLERSFGPAYARGTLRRGSDAWALVAVNAQESQTTIDSILTVGLLWLHHCREHAGGRRLYGGLRIILPRGTSTTTRARLPWLNPKIARYELFEVDESSEEFTQLDPADHGNLATRLIEAPDLTRALTPGSRFAPAIPGILALLPPFTEVIGLPNQPSHTLPSLPAPGAHSKTAHLPDPGHRAEARLRSSAELTFSLHGLPFARIRLGYAGQSFNRQLIVTVGAGPDETPLTPESAPHLRELVHALFARRTALGAPRDPLFRASPESWLGSNLRHNLPDLDPHLEPDPVYPEVPALTGGGRSLDRGMLDLLAVTRTRQLAVLEIKATEDLHLALQGLDYWIRIRQHHLGHTDPTTGLGELQQRGYFPGTRLLAEPPHLYLIAPALQIHPATETILRYLDPRIPWTLIALDQRWRTRIRPVWKRRSSDPQH